MAPVDVDERLHRDQAQPDEEGAGRVLEPVVEALLRGHVRLLDHVVGVDAPRESRVEPEVDRPPESLAMPVEELAEDVSLSAAQSGQEQLIVGELVSRVGQVCRTSSSTRVPNGNRSPTT